MHRVLRRLVSAVTMLLVLLALAISVAWFFDMQGGSRFEPAVEGVGLIGALVGVFADRRVAAWERRHQTLLTLGDELSENGRVLYSPVFREKPRGSGPQWVYPRLRTSAVEAALATGTLMDFGDTELLRCVHRWRQDASDFNHRLDLMELRGLLVEKDGEPQRLHAQMMRDGGAMARLREQLAAIIAHLRTHYGAEDAIRLTLPAQTGPPDPIASPAMP